LRRRALGFEQIEDRLILLLGTGRGRCMRRGEKNLWRTTLRKKGWLKRLFVPQKKAAKLEGALRPSA
jgi:hypothetical protein